MGAAFSNRPYGVKRFQTTAAGSVDVAHGLVLLFGNGHQGPFIMGFEDGVEQSWGRPSLIGRMGSSAFRLSAAGSVDIAHGLVLRSISPD